MSEDTTVNILDLPIDNLKVIADYAGGLACAMMQFTCKGFAVVIRGKALKRNLICVVATREGRLGILEWLHMNWFPLGRYVCANAAKYGHLDILKWLQSRVPFDILTSAYAARGGHLDILKWLEANNCVVDATTCAYAAKSGHIHILEYLYTRYYSFRSDDKACAMAAKKGRLDVLKWLRRKGCAWSSYTCICAAEYGHLKVFDWAYRHNCPIDHESVSISAAVNEDIALLKYMHNAGLDIDDEAWEEAADRGKLKSLKWAKKKGYPVNMKYVASRGYDDLREWAATIRGKPAH